MKEGGLIKRIWWKLLFCPQFLMLLLGSQMTNVIFVPLLANSCRAFFFNSATIKSTSTYWNLMPTKLLRLNCKNQRFLFNWWLIFHSFFFSDLSHEGSTRRLLPWTVQWKVHGPCQTSVYLCQVDSRIQMFASWWSSHSFEILRFWSTPGSIGWSFW